MKKIIAFSGSNSSKSINQQLIRWTAEQITSAEVEVIDLRDYPAPIYSNDTETEEGIPATMQELSAKIIAADAVIISSPEHNGYMPAVLKNTIDWMSRTGSKPFADKKVLLMSTSPGARGGITNLTNMAAIMPYWGATIVDTLAIGSFYDKVNDGEPSEELAALLVEKTAKLEEAMV